MGYLHSFPAKEKTRELDNSQASTHFAHIMHRLASMCDDGVRFAGQTASQLPQFVHSQPGLLVLTTLVIPANATTPTNPPRGQT
jgi:hypothetical protein